ncbi:MAG: T9SS type A sorting domain-containing protein [Bacteroidota bacterium]
MRYIISILLLTGAIQVLNAQNVSVAPEVVATAGESYTSSTVNVDWTLGEVMTESFDGTIVLTQGFHQPEIKITSIKDPAAGFGLVKVYPNPSAGSISIEREKNGDLQLTLWDINGRLLMQQGTASALHTLDLSSLPTGMYILRLSDGKQGARSIRIQKL